MRRKKGLLYIVTLLFAVLAVVSASIHCFPKVPEMVCYVLAALTLSASIFYLTTDIRNGIKNVIKPGIMAVPYAGRIAADYRMRTVLSAVPGLAGNIVFAVFNGFIGIYSHSAWFGSLSAYYLLMSIMRTGAVGQEWKISKIKEESRKIQKEIAIYRRNSLLFILMSVVLCGMVILLETSLGGKSYPGFTIYAVACYTFYRVILSIINMIKVNRLHSPLLAIIRKIGYIDACVSLLTLQTAMFASFADGQVSLVRLMNGITGTVVCVMVLGMGLQGVYASRKMIK